MKLFCKISLALIILTLFIKIILIDNSIFFYNKINHLISKETHYIEENKNINKNIDTNIDNIKTNKYEKDNGLKDKFNFNFLSRNKEIKLEKTFINKKNNFSIKYNKEWIIEEFYGGYITLIKLDNSNNKNKINNINNNINIFIETIDENIIINNNILNNYDLLEYYKDKSLKDILLKNNNQNDIELLEEKKITINNSLGYEIKYQNNTKGKSFIQNQIFYILENKVYIFTLSVNDEKEYQDILLTFRELVKSLTLI